MKRTADFLEETMKVRSEWQNILKVMKGKNLQTIFLYIARVTFRFYGEIKSFTDKKS